MFVFSGLVHYSCHSKCCNLFVLIILVTPSDVTSLLCLCSIFLSLRVVQLYFFVLNIFVTASGVTSLFVFNILVTLNGVTSLFMFNICVAPSGVT